MTDSKRNNKLLFLCTVLLAVAIGLFIFGTAVTSSAKLVVPNVVEFSLSNDVNDLNWGIYNDIKVKFDENNYYWTAYSAKTGTLTDLYSHKSTNARIVATDGYYAKAYGLQMLRGNFFKDSYAAEAGSYCVISENLAMQLYNGIDVIGNWVDVAGSPCMIIGIYKVDHSLLSAAAWETLDSVYIHYASLPDWKNTKVTNVGLKMIDATTWTSLYDMLNEAIDSTNKGNITKLDFQTERDTVTQFPAVANMMVAVLCCIMLIAFIVASVAAVLARVKKRISELYFKDMVRREWLYLTTMAIWIVVCIAGVLLIFTRLTSQLSIPDRWISYTNIFDIKYYLNAWVQDRLNIYNNPEIFTNDIFRFSGIAFKLLFSAYGIGTLLYLIGLRLFALGNNGIKGYIRPLIAAIFGIVIGFFMQYFYGLEINIPIGTVLIIMLPIFIMAAKELIKLFLEKWAKY